MITSTTTRVLVPALLALALVACGEDEAPPPAAPTPGGAKKKADAAPVAAVAQVDYVYTSVGKRDPFRSFGEPTPGPQGPSTGPEAGPECTEPLCLMDLDDLNVVAVVSGDSNPLAMVEDAKHVGFIVRRNTRIGKQGGKVIQILRDCIVVLSFVSGGPDGKPQANKQNLCVKTESAAGPEIDLLRNKEFVP